LVEQVAVRLEQVPPEADQPPAEAVGVSSSRRKLRDGKASKFRETLQSKGNPEPSPEPEHSEWFGEGAETRHSLPKSEKDMVKV